MCTTRPSPCTTYPGTNLPAKNGGNRGQTGCFLIFSSGHGALSSSGCGRCSSSCYATRQSAGIHSLVQCRTYGVFRPALAGCATLSTVAHRLLPDVELRSSDRDSTRADALALAFNRAHNQYASYWNASHASSGHAWQGRFYSCPLNPVHLWEALRYAELNPIRAGLVAEPQTWRWSSAAAHWGMAEPDICLAMEMWRQHWSPSTRPGTEHQQLGQRVRPQAVGAIDADAGCLACGV